MNRIALGALLICGTICGASPGLAHYVDPAGEKQHKHTHKQIAKKSAARHVDAWDLLGMALTPALASSSNVRIYIAGDKRIVKSTGLPDHATGVFPNAHNPNTMYEQDYTFSMPAQPRLADRETRIEPNPFGIAINGIPFDPGTAESWNNDPTSGWHYEGMALGWRLGLDQNNAHVQPSGAYHYHGIPTGLLAKFAATQKPVLIGYAGDGFPTYGPYGYNNAADRNSGMKKLKSSYRKKSGSRPSGGPPGAYDGVFVEDWEYVPGLGDLDSCNGRYGVTPEFPSGTYYYVVTDSFPYISRRWKGTPDPSFQTRRPPHLGGGRGGPAGPGGFGPGGPGTDE
jgi:hypothetical protein